MSAASQPPPRLVPEAPLPPYAYLSGRNPHPTSDPRGHSFGHAANAPPPIDPALPLESRQYLLACDLFNHGYYWEAHEEWEGLWKAAGRHGTTADFLKALIHLAAAGVKVREQRPQGVVRHAARAGELIREVRGAVDAGSSTYLGLDLHWLAEVASQLEREPIECAISEEPVQRVFEFCLVPQSA